MTTTVRAIYQEGVLKLRRLLPLPAGSEVLVTVELPSESTESVVVQEEAAAWPDITARLQSIYGDKVLPENAILNSRADERY
jgi:predicted DNA-binding antitoxin AbrB/MazE fold protein